MWRKPFSPTWLEWLAACPQALCSAAGSTGTPVLSPPRSSEANVAVEPVKGKPSK
jgi:hypothetical protein